MTQTNDDVLSDPELYEELSTPQTQEAGERNLKEFLERVQDLREEYGIPDVLVAAAVNVANGEVLVSLFNRGDRLRAQHLSAQLYGAYVTPHLEQLRILRDEPIRRG